MQGMSLLSSVQVTMRPPACALMRLSLVSHYCGSAQGLTQEPCFPSQDISGHWDNRKARELTSVLCLFKVGVLGVPQPCAIIMALLVDHEAGPDSVAPIWQQLLSLQRVSKSFQSLIQLYLANMRRFDSSQIRPGIPRAAFVNLLKDNKVLQQLALQNCSDWLTDCELLPVIEQNHHLHQIQLKGCVQLSRHALVTISLSCPNLRQLSLAQCDWVDSLALRSLADHCKALEAVDLTACRQLKDEAICYLVQKCSRLKSLSLAVNANVGDVAVEETAKCCPELEHLDLTGCLRVKNDSIRVLAEYCPKLRSLKVKHCHNVAESSLSVLRSRGVELDVEPPLQRALVLLQDVVGFAPFINLQI
ncbi:F-box/LRR-repeat protein 15 [Pitangus sulphuratus]|nr:F-box/LRR-repeat protein 15 [Pitangus sulphuratus]